MENYRNLDFEIYVRLHDLQGILSHYQVEDEYFQNINRHMELIRTKQYRVAVIGEFSRGKSSLLNALLGGRILPSDITPTTATINRITFDLDQRVEIRFRDGTSSVIDITALEDYVTKLTDEGEHTAETVSEAIIYYPTVICQNNIDLIDTPGLNEDEKMTRLTIGQLEKIDAAVVLVSALSPMDQIEIDLVCKLIESPEIDCLVFVISFIDCIEQSDRERVKNLICRRIRSVIDILSAKYGNEHEITNKSKRILSNLEIYSVSSSQALMAMEANDRRLLKESNFPEFQKALYRILAAQQTKNALVKTLRILVNAVDYLENWFTAKYSRLNEKLKSAEKNHSKLQNYYLCCRSSATSIISRNTSNIDKYLTSNSLCLAYNQFCIKALSEVYSDDESVITSAIADSDREINIYTEGDIKIQQETFLKQIQNCINEIATQRDANLCDPIIDFDKTMSVKMHEYEDEIRNEIRDFSTDKLSPYSFFEEGTRSLSDRQVRKDTSYELTDMRCCNYIAYMKIQNKNYAEKAVNWFKNWCDELVQVVYKLQTKDEALKDTIIKASAAWIKNCRDDITVNEKLYEKHKSELGQMKIYAQSTIKSIQEEEIS